MSLQGIRTIRMSVANTGHCERFHNVSHTQTKPIWYCLVLLPSQLHHTFHTSGAETARNQIASDSLNLFHFSRSQTL